MWEIAFIHWSDVYQNQDLSSKLANEWHYFHRYFSCSINMFFLVLVDMVKNANRLCKIALSNEIWNCKALSCAYILLPNVTVCHATKSHYQANKIIY